MIDTSWSRSRAVGWFVSGSNWSVVPCWLGSVLIHINRYIQVSSMYANVLFNPSATNSFTFVSFVKRNCKMSPSLDTKLCISTPNGSIILVNPVCKSRVASIKDRKTIEDLLDLNMRARLTKPY